jgi:spore coat polysaccharide biosynthesis protein SpsF (cytidylyltransferase family)
MTELAKIIFEKIGSFRLDKKQVAKLMGKSVGFIDAAIHKNRLEKIPRFTKTGTIDFSIQDVADFLEKNKLPLHE